MVSVCFRLWRTFEPCGFIQSLRAYRQAVQISRNSLQGSSILIVFCNFLHKLLFFLHHFSRNFGFWLPSGFQARSGVDFRCQKREKTSPFWRPKSQFSGSVLNHFFCYIFDSILDGIWDVLGCPFLLFLTLFGHIFEVQVQNVIFPIFYNPSMVLATFSGWRGSEIH